MPSVLFNASVVLAGFKSPKGGSGKIIQWVKKGKLKGIVSEPILDEVLRNAQKLGFEKENLAEKIIKIFNIQQEPKEKIVNQFKGIVLYFGDAHVLASSRESKSDYLVTLDQKHLLVLKNKIKEFKVVTPGELIKIITKLNKT